MPYVLSRHPLLALVAAVLFVSAAAGVAADKIAARRRPLVERAHDLERSRRFDAAEKLYLELVGQRPGDVLLIVDLLDNHDHLARLRRASKRQKPDELEISEADLDPAVDEARIDAVLASPALSEDGALLVRWWRLVLTTGARDDVERAVLAAAHRMPPAPWANHLLGRAADLDGNETEAAEYFAREASAFEERGGDATAACHIWIDAGGWEALASALADAKFSQQVPAVVRIDLALHRRDWASAMRWFFPSQYESTTTGVLLLAALSGIVWFGFCALVGHVRERPKLRIPLYVAAFVLGVLSTYLTIALAIFEETFLHFTEKGQPAVDAIYFVFGVGLREELSKALLFLPLVPILKRFGTRRDALACGALVGLGFAAEENLGYFHLGLSTALARFLTANFLHLSTTGIVAVAIDDAVRGRDDTVTGWSQTIPLVVLTHGVYDFFLSDAAGGGSSFVSMFCFVLLSRRFVNVIRTLKGREGPLLPFFVVGLAVVAGGTFVYAATLVGAAHAATAMAIGAFGLVIVAYVFGREFGSV